jgi:rSAM/selenodomain-associated transferase 2
MNDMATLMTPAPEASICVVVPALNEGAVLGRLLAELTPARFHDIVVVDNGSTDETAAIASRHPGVRLVRATRGRGRALNTGALATSADILLFLHADTALPRGARAMIGAAMAHPAVVGGCFRLSFDRRSALLRLYAWFTRYDTAFTTFGDQAYFIRRRAFERVGGFPEWPILEDVEMRRRLKRAGRFVKLPSPVVTSARRFRKHGVVRQQLRNIAIIALFHLGLSPEQLARWYRPHRG